MCSLLGCCCAAVVQNRSLRLLAACGMIDVRVVLCLCQEVAADCNFAKAYTQTTPFYGNQRGSGADQVVAVRCTCYLALESLCVCEIPASFY